ncbi:MAG: acyltransferase family protein [Alistipes sp.]|nr:acyltransferase family protein [Alistipes sp.]
MTNPQPYSTSSERIVFLDYVRVVAIFMVLLVHSIEPFYLGGQGTLVASFGDALWVTFLDSALRCAVPLFVMTSSYLLVPIKGDGLSFLKRRFLRVGIPFIVWSLLYAIIPFWGTGGQVDVEANLSRLVFNFTPYSGHLWFVYMIFGIYIIMPIISPWLERVSPRGERMFIMVWLLSTAVPFLRLAASETGNAEVWGEASWNEFGTLYYTSGFIGYIVTAHYIRKHVDWSVAKTVCVALPMFVVGYAIVALPFYWQLPAEYPVEGPIDLAVAWERSWCFATTGVALTTIALFLLFKLITKPCRIYPLFEAVSKLSYGIYLVHIFVLVAVFGYVSSWGLATPVVMILSATITFVVSALIVKLLSLVPKSKYFIG